MPEVQSPHKWNSVAQQYLYECILAAGHLVGHLFVVTFWEADAMTVVMGHIWHKL